MHLGRFSGGLGRRRRGESRTRPGRGASAIPCGTRFSPTFSTPNGIAPWPRRFLVHGPTLNCRIPFFVVIGSRMKEFTVMPDDGDRINLGRIRQEVPAARPAKLPVMFFLTIRRSRYSSSRPWSSTTFSVIVRNTRRPSCSKPRPRSPNAGRSALRSWWRLLLPRGRLALRLRQHRRQ